MSQTNTDTTDTTDTIESDTVDTSVEEGSSVIEDAIDTIDSDESPEDSKDSFLDRIDEELGFEEPKEDESEEKDSTDEAESGDSTDGDEDDDVDFPKAEELDGLDDKAKIQWGKLRSELKETKAAQAALADELEGVRKQAPVTELETQLKQVTAELEEFRQSAAVYDVEKSDEYVAQVAEPIEAMMDVAEEIATRNEIPPEDLIDAMALEGKAQDEKLRDITEDMSDRDKNRVYRMMDDAAIVFQRSQQMKDQAAELAVKYENADLARKEQAAKKSLIEVRSGIEKVFEKFQKVTPSLGEDVSFEAIKAKTMEEDFSTLTPNHRAYALAAGAVVPKMISALRARDAEIAKLNGELSGMVKAKPKAGGDHSSATPVSEGKSLMDVIENELGLS